jgi:hypothetical protein
LQRVYRKLDPDIEAWLVDTGRFLLLFVSLLIAQGVFKILRALGINRNYVDVLEWSDHFANGCVFILYLVAILRTALAGSVAPRKV